MYDTPQQNKEDRGGKIKTPRQQDGNEDIATRIINEAQTRARGI